MKDLNTPWTKLPSLISSADEQSSRENTPERDYGLAKPVTHSALTTLLLDDSPRKAELQPYNHFCVPEYSAALRAQDLDVLHAEQAHAAVSAKPDDHEICKQPPPTDLAAHTELGEKEGVDTALDIDNPRKRKRKEKMDLKRLQATLGAADSTSSSDVEYQPPKAYDETLLAVIGVLEEVKMQRNVAAWMRSGALWGPTGRPGSATSTNSAAPAETDADHPASVSIESPILPSSSTAVSPSRSPAASEEPTVVDAGDGTTAQVSESPDDRQARRKEKKRRRQLAKQVEREKGSGSPPAGNDALSSTDPAQAVPQAVGTEEAASPLMWFEHAPTVQYWVSRARKALAELSIPINHGIDR